MNPQQDEPREEAPTDPERTATEDEDEHESSSSFKVPVPPENDEEEALEKDAVKNDAEDDDETNATTSITSSGQTQPHSNNNNNTNNADHSSPPLSPAQERVSSLELRKLPVNDLLRPERKDSTASEQENDNQESSCKRAGILRMTCLNPKFELRTQLMLSFDSVNFITILVVVLICVAVSLKTGDNIKAINSQTFSTLAQDVQGRTARYLAESLEHRIIPRDVVQLMYEVTRDRFQGYPTFTDDSQVPFRNMDNNASVYPIIGEPLPLDWQLNTNDLVTEESNEEYVQGRMQLYGGNPLSAADGAFIMQGACDPAQTDPTSRTYWPNCTDANNDIFTGGTMRPSNLTETIHKKASDLVPFMKALYEYNRDVREIGVYFANQGVGATVNFPHYELDAQNTYTATGCEWMKEPNPYDPTRPIGTQEEIDQCYPEGAVLSARQYSPLGRAWCRDQALHPEKVLVEGPFLDAWVDNTWIVSSGRAVYDRVTKDFVACIFVGITTTFLEQIMEESRVTANSEVSVVRWDPQGTVVASSAGSSSAIVDLNVGLTNETYADLYNLVDYDMEWNPSEVQEAYESFVSRDDGFTAAAYPIPPVPDEYDPTYLPVFLAIVSTAEADVFDKVEEVNDDVDERTNQAILFAVIAGAVGFVLATIVILITATAITRPLQLMNKEAKLIVGSFGDEGSGVEQIKPIHVKYSRCVPHTEITDVVTEFNKTISSFSGSRMARSEGVKYVEIVNMFDLGSDFMDLYKSREPSDLPFGVIEAVTDASPDKHTRTSTVGGVSSSMGSSPRQFTHTGTNLKVGRRGRMSRRVISSKDLKSEKRTASPLFIWIVILIVTPLLLTTITISAVVLSSMSREFDESVKDSEAHYLDVALQALSVYAGLRADYVSTYSSRSVRDLYLMSRVASWIMFDGLERANSFTEAMTEVNECLEAASSSACPWAIENRVCDCAWNYDDDECEEYDEVESRSLQIPYFYVSSDAALPNGTRLRTDFPSNSVSPSTTLWWDGPYELPGSDKNESASGYSTTYDRMRVISAFPLFPVLANYDIEKENADGHFFGFEDDGLFVAYEGCFNSEHSIAAFWQSTEENGAEALRPELCPLDKYGYDPRCREWYDTGRKKAISGGDSLYITSPYTFVGGAFVAQSATSPLMDPRTGSYVGQVLLDFSVTDIFGVLTSSSTPLSAGGFPLLITVDTSSFDGDTVIGPGYNGSVSSQPVSHVVMPFDQECQDDRCTNHRRMFDTIVASMKAGNSSLSQFERTTSDGGTETIYLASAPVSVHYLDPANVSDFSRGALMRNHLTYSLGFAETGQGILEPFLAIQEDMQRQINIAIGILAAVIAVAVAATIGICYVVARSISEPMACLLQLVRLLNRRDVDQDPPMVDQSMGSKEIINVSHSMESLYRVVRLANLSFYVGDLEAAYRVLVDALRLFRRLDNEKAIGVACNNLGNTMLAMYREMQSEEAQSKFGVTRQDIIEKGTAYFHEAIQLGEKAYDEFYDIEGWSPNCLDFMQHLSNRYFNRAIFLLTVKNDHPQPEEIQSLGFRDLEVARDMDAEIEAQGEESGWGSVNRAEKLFNVHLVRIRGHLLLLETGYSDDWEIEESLCDLFEMLANESRKPASDLFNEVTYIGRLQQAETEMMKHLLIKGDVARAAKIAIRILVEDEHIFLDAAARAVKVLQAYVASSDCDVDKSLLPLLKESLDDIMHDLSQYSETRKQSVDSIRSHRVASKSLRNIGDFLDRKPSSSTRWSVSDQSGQFVTMEQF